MKTDIICLDSLMNIIIEAGKKIIPLRKDIDSFNISKKNDNSLITNADLLSNDIICSELIKTKIPILSEENIIIPKSNLFWMIDPLDGTKDYVNNSNEFTVNIALIDRGIPTIGLIYAPAFDQLFVKYLDKDCFSIINNKKFSLENLENTKEILLLASKSEKSQFYNKIKEKYNVVKESSISSSLKFGKLFTNEFNTYVRTVGSSEWDIAAGHALLLGVGGNIIDLKTKQQMNYNKLNFRNSSFIAFNSDKNPLNRNLHKL